MTSVAFTNQTDYDRWIDSKPDFSAVTCFLARNLPRLAALPAIPNVTDFRVTDLPLLASLPAMPNVTTFWANNLPLLADLPAMPNVTDFRVTDLPLLASCKPEYPASRLASAAGASDASHRAGIRREP